MSVYSKEHISQAIQDGRIACHPFNPDHLKGSALHLTIGHYYYRVEKANERTIYNPFDPEEVERYFDGPYKAMPHLEWSKLNGVNPVKNIDERHPLISLRPGERILAHSHEYLGVESTITVGFKTLAEWSRNGIVIGTSIFETGLRKGNRVVLEIINTNERETVLIPVGEPVVAAIFAGTDAELSEPEQPADLDSAIKIWAPDMLIPRAYQNQRRMPPKIQGAQYE